MLKLAKKLFPLNRSLTGKGNIKTLKILKQINPDLKIYKFRSGEKVYDWKIPKVWDVNQLTFSKKKIWFLKIIFILG